MATIIDCAKACQITYEKLPLPCLIGPGDWLEESYNIANPLPPRHYFYAKLWVNKQKSEAIISFRGSEDFIDFYQDYKTWKHDVFPTTFNNHHYRPYFHQAHQFYLRCCQYLSSEYRNIRLLLTGHSLGGAIALFIMQAVNLPLTVITFNTPGIGNILTHPPQYPKLITNINSKYGLINKIGLAIGNTILIDIPEGEQEAKTILQDIKIIEAIDQFKKKILAKNHRTLLDYCNLANLDKMSDVYKIKDTFNFMYPFLAQHSIKNMTHTLSSKLYECLRYTNFISPLTL